MCSKRKTRTDADDQCKEKLAFGSRHSAGQDPVKRAQILSGAQDIFLDKGFEATSMSDVAREAGVSKGTLYVYFTNKDDLFEAICYEYRRIMFSELAEILEQGPYSKEQLIQFGLLLSKRFLAEKAVTAQRIVLGIRERNPEITHGFYHSGPKRLLDSVERYLSHLVSLKLLQIPDMHLAACQLVDLFFAGLYRPRLFGVLSEEEALKKIELNVNNAVDFFFRGYSPDK
ncbi:TetR/AcrR family transcriptional regulator [Brucellaceae bacterium C25G]